jgi:hypothetical protein
MGVRIRSRLAGEAAPSASELDRRAVMSIRDYIETADDIEKLTNGRHATTDHLALSAARN